jgi:hypothetical protein
MKSLSSIRKVTIVLIPLVVLVLILGALACVGKGTTPTPTATVVPIATPTPAALFLKVTSPEDESAVSTGDVTVTGSTIPGAVVSLSVGNNTVMADVDQNGNFQAVVPLGEGPNQIDVVASDRQGNEESANVTVMMYAP